MEQYPAKTCSVERLITRSRDIEKVLQGRKTSQRRNGLYAYPGEKMELKGHVFEITAVYPQTLGEMGDQDAKNEGMENKSDYLKYMDQIHPGFSWSPTMQMWVHEFQEVPSS